MTESIPIRISTWYLETKYRTRWIPCTPVSIVVSGDDETTIKSNPYYLKAAVRRSRGKGVNIDLTKFRVTKIVLGKIVGHKAR